MSDVEVVPLPIRQIVKSYLLRGEDGTVLVDAGPRGKQHVVLRQIREAGVAPEDIGLIVVTHCHHDHTWGLAELQAKTGAEVAAHLEAVPWLREGRQPDLNSTGLLASVLKLFIQMASVARLPEVDPDIAVSDGLDLRNHGVAAEVISTPGHTSGSLSVITECGDAIIGDLIMGLPNPNSPRLPLWAEDLEEVKDSIREVLAHDPRTIYVAHGGPFEPDQIRALIQ